MIKEYLAFFELFQKGKEVADPAKWKSHTITANMLVTLFASCMVIARGMGYGVNIDDGTLNTFASGIIAAYGVINAIMTTITSKKVGVN